MSFSGRYPEHDICENFNAIDVRELQRKTGLRPGLCFIKEWFRNGAPAGEVFIFTQPDAIILVYRARPPGATESRIVELQVPIIWTKCHLGGRRPWFKCLTITNGEVCGRRVAKLYGPCFNPIALARAGYWRGRAADAMNKPQEARAHYEQGARYSTAYYGQLARAKIGLIVRGSAANAC